MKVFAIYSQSLDMFSRHFLAVDMKQAIDFVLNHLYDCRDAGLIQGTYTNDLSIVELCDVPAAVDFDSDAGTRISDLEPAQKFISKLFEDSKSYRKVD